MAKFTSYRRIGDFVIEVQLDPSSNDLSIICTVYYELPDKDITKVFHLSKANKQINLNIYSKRRNYMIKGKLELHYRHFPSSEILNIYGRLTYGIHSNLQSYEGVIAQIDNKEGNRLENTSEFPNIQDIYNYPNFLEEEDQVDFIIDPSPIAD